MARIPLVITNQGGEIRNLSEERRNKWISAISRKDLTDSILDQGRVSLHTEPEPAVHTAAKTVLSCQSFGYSPQKVHFG